MDIYKNKKKKEIRLIIVLFVILIVSFFLEFILLKIHDQFNLTESILLFIFINLNLVILLVLIFLILRNIANFYYERQKNYRPKIRRKVFTAFIATAMIPNILLFIISANFITSTLEYWFKAPIENALEESIVIGQKYYESFYDISFFFIKHNLKPLTEGRYLNKKGLEKEFQSSPFDIVEIYNLNKKRIFLKTKDGIQVPEYKLNRIKNFPLSIQKTISGKVFSISYSRIGDYFIAVAKKQDEVIKIALERISRGRDEYQQIKLLKNSVQFTYITALFVTSLLVFFAALWFASKFAKTITEPLDELVVATSQLATGNLGYRLPEVENLKKDEIDFLIDSFNKMSSDIKSKNDELKTRAKFIEIILKDIATGVIAFDSGGVISVSNSALCEMFEVIQEDIKGRVLHDVLPAKYCEIADSYVAGHIDDSKIPLQLIINGNSKNLLLNFSTLYAEDGDHIGYLATCDDVTELEKAQRMSAWQEVARQIAHEVKNPLTPISLAAQRMQKYYKELSEDKVFKGCTKTIIEHVGIIKNLVNEFATYARFPAPQKSLYHFKDILDYTIPRYQEKYRDIKFMVNLPDDLPEIYMDRRQIGQAFMNLIDNAAAAMCNKGRIDINFQYMKNKNLLRIEFADSGPGVLESEKKRLFEPYFSTKKSGTGLGLTIVNSIISSHEGSITLSDYALKGACFIIELPV